MDDSDARKGKAKEKEMNEQKQIEAMARADGYVLEREMPFKELGSLYSHPDKIGYFLSDQLPAYTTSHDACQRVIDGLGREFQWEYSLQLQKTTTGILDGKSGAELTLNALLATALQKCEAILKALGKWTKEME